MKVLSIGTDIKLFEEESSVLERQKEYASKLEELHIVVFTRGGFSEKRFGNLHIYPTNSKIFSLFLGWFKIKKILKNKEGFVITTQDPFETGLLGVIVKYLYKVPLQLQVHTDFLSPYFKNTFLNSIRVFISKFVLPNADGIRAVSSVIKDTLAKKYPNIASKISILPIWVNIEGICNNGFPIGGEEYKKNLMFPVTILTVSRLTKEKRLDIAIKEFKKVTEKTKKDVGLYIVGSGPEQDYLESIIYNLNLNKKVKMVGWEEKSKIESTLFRLADIFLLTSDFEGYGMTLIEAGASGCPIVTTKVGLAKTELFKDGINSYVCPVGDVDCLAKKLTNLVEDENERKSFSQNMKESIKSIAISREEYINRYISLLEKLLIKSI